jgi:hypothetical protein
MYTSALLPGPAQLVTCAKPSRKEGAQSSLVSRPYLAEVRRACTHVRSARAAERGASERADAQAQAPRAERRAHARTRGRRRRGAGKWVHARASA